MEERARAAFPDLSGPVRHLNSGFRSEALLMGKVIVRVGRVPEAADGYAREARLLPRLAGRLPVAIPQPSGFAPPSEAVPYGAIAYALLPGSALQPAQISREGALLLAKDLAHFLRALHQIPPVELGLPAARAEGEGLEQMGREVLPVLRDWLTPREVQLVERWWSGVRSDSRLGRFTPVLQHGDLWYENILVDARAERVLGVVDWEGAGPGDPAQDITTLLHCGERFARLVADAYRELGGVVDPGFWHRVRRRWELRPFDGLHWAIRAHDEEEMRDAVRKLRAGPILAPARRGTTRRW